MAIISWIKEPNPYIKIAGEPFLHDDFNIRILLIGSVYTKEDIGSNIPIVQPGQHEDKTIKEKDYNDLLQVLHDYLEGKQLLSSARDKRVKELIELLKREIKC